MSSNLIKIIRPAALCIILAAFISTPCSAASKYSRLLKDPEGRKKLQALARMEERGSLDHNMRVLVKDPDPLVRLRCAETLGRVDDTPETAGYLSRLAADDDDDVVLAAVFSLGITGGQDTGQTTLETLSDCLHGRTLDIKKAAAASLGRTRNKKALPVLLPLLTNFNSSLRAEAALALAALQDSSAAEDCLIALNDPVPHVVACTVYALGRLGYDKSSDEIIPLLASEDREVRMRTAEALGRFREKKAVGILIGLLDDPVRMVAVKSAEALSRIASRPAARGLEKALESPDPYMRYLALEGTAAAGKDGRAFEKAASLLQDKSLMVRLAAIRAAALSGQDKSRDLLLEIIKNGRPQERMTALEYLGPIGMREDLPLLEEKLLSTEDHLAGEGAASAFKRWEDKDALFEQAGGKRPVDALFEAAEGHDWVVATISLEALGEIFRNDMAGRLASIYAASGGRTGGDKRLAIIDILKSAAGRGDIDDATLKAVTGILTAGMADGDPRVASAAVETAGKFGIARPAGAKKEKAWDRGQPLVEGSLPLGIRKIEITTRKGRIEVELFGDEAPNIVANILALASEGFYDGLDFHRVVPGFVIQGGCPRGDGWGDPGFFLRSEFNRHGYDRGTVGMAHSGKDTPGSQFFITQLPQPHLDGRYTVIGRVVSGMRIVDSTETGDSFTVRVVD